MDQHDLQHGDILALVHKWLTVHRPENQEEYEEGGAPVMYYGHFGGLK